MSARARYLNGALAELDERIKLAEEAYTKARDTFSRFEGSPAHPMWAKLRSEVDTTLTHMRVLQAVWHRTKADLLDQLNIDKE